MNLNRFLTLCIIAISISGCQKNTIGLDNDLVKDGKPITASTSFYPMQIGNYWKINDQNYTEIVDTASIGGKVYYEFYSHIGGDAISIQYLRIDENQNLIESYPTNTTYNYTLAEFNAKVNDTFHTLSSGGVNDFMVTVLYKSATKMTFRLNNTLPNGNSTPIVHTYYKGIGPDDKYTTIKIDGKVYNYQ
jgi:hypothetical protein